MKKILWLSWVILLGTTGLFANAGWANALKLVASDSVLIDPMPMPYPYEITQQRYVYSGTLPTDVSDFPIYKWVNAMIENEKVKDVISSLKIDQFDLSKLQNTTLTNVTLKENKENGFRVTLDFEGGYLSVFKDYNSAYYARMQQNPTFTAMSDEEALALANDFISTYGINVSSFGKPYVEKPQNYPVAYAMDAAVSTTTYVDPYVQIVFPTIIDGKNVNERYGQNAGLRISVSNQDKSIQGFSLKVEKLASTTEANLITDSSRINKIIEKGWYDYNYDYGTGYTVKYQDIELTNARVEYTKVETWKDGAAGTYYGPSLVFDVVKPQDGSYYGQDKMIVPLIDKAYEQY